MTTPRFAPWRPFFLLSALLLLAGGPMHPGGSMEQMLADPRWVPGHALVSAGCLALLAGLVLLARRALPERTARWARWAVAATALQSVEMVVHTAAAVDHANLVAGRATPVLTTHLWLAAVLYPVFGAVLVGLVAAGARERSLGSWWIAPIGVLGFVAHGLAAPIAVMGGPEVLRVLFLGLAVFALWIALAALWPVRAAAAAPVPGAPRPRAAAEPAVQ